MYVIDIYLSNSSRHIIFQQMYLFIFASLNDIEMQMIIFLYFYVNWQCWRAQTLYTVYTCMRYTSEKWYIMLKGTLV